MAALLDSLLQLFWALWNVVVSLGGVIVPWLALIAFVAYWLLAVNWDRLWVVLIEQGGIIGVIFIGLMAVLIWGVIAPPEAGYHAILGLKTSNFFGKAIYVFGLIAIMLSCGGLQLAGTVDRYLVFRKRGDDAPAT